MTYFYLISRCVLKFSDISSNNFMIHNLGNKLVLIALTNVHLEKRSLAFQFDSIWLNKYLDFLKLELMSYFLLLIILKYIIYHILTI